jgi:hypothetical protein
MEMKRGLLMEDFKSADINHDDNLSEHEILQYLDSKVSTHMNQFNL